MAAARQLGEELKQHVQSLESRREQLLKKFGNNVAFVKQEDQVKVAPGQIPLGNLFDIVITLPTLIASFGKIAIIAF